MDFLDVIEKRRSVRKYADRPVEKEVLDAIVRVAQTAPSSRNSKSSAFMIIEDRDTLDALSQMRDYGSALLSGAQAAIVILGDDTKTDLWVDNCAISATFVQLAVTAMDLVSCWVHITVAHASRLSLKEQRQRTTSATFSASKTASAHTAP